MKNNIKKTFILTLVMILIITFFSSCKDIHHIDPDTTNADTTKKGEFEYTDSDDLPIELNAIHGGKSIIYYDGYIYCSQNYAINIMEIQSANRQHDICLPRPAL